MRYYNCANFYKFNQIPSKQVSLQYLGKQQKSFVNYSKGCIVQTIVKPFGSMETNQVEEKILQSNSTHSNLISQELVPNKDSFKIANIIQQKIDNSQSLNFRQQKK